MNRIISVLIAISFLFSNISLVSGINTAQYKEDKLAPHSRIQLFFSKNDVELSTPQEMALSMAMGKLQKSIIEEEKSDITGEIQQLNENLSTVNIEITTINLEIDPETKIPYVTITVSDSEKNFRAYFLKKNQRKVNKRLMIEEKDLRHFDSPGLEGVWFVNIGKIDKDTRTLKSYTNQLVDNNILEDRFNNGRYLNLYGKDIDGAGRLEDAYKDKLEEWRRYISGIMDKISKDRRYKYNENINSLRFILLEDIPYTGHFGMAGSRKEPSIYMDLESFKQMMRYKDRPNWLPYSRPNGSKEGKLDEYFEDWIKHEVSRLYGDAHEDVVAESEKWFSPDSYGNVYKELSMILERIQAKRLIKDFIEKFNEGLDKVRLSINYPPENSFEAGFSANVDFYNHQNPLPREKLQLLINRAKLSEDRISNIVARFVRSLLYGYANDEWVTRNIGAGERLKLFPNTQYPSATDQIHIRESELEKLDKQDITDECSGRILTILEGKAPQAHQPVISALRNRNGTIQRGPFAGVDAKIRIMQVDTDDAIGFYDYWGIVEKERVGIPTLVYLTYDVDKDGLVCNINLSRRLVESFTSNMLAQSIVNILLKLILGRTDIEAEVEEPLYNADSETKKPYSDLAMFLVDHAIKTQQYEYIRELIRVQCGSEKQFFDYDPLFRGYYRGLTSPFDLSSWTIGERREEDPTVLECYTGILMSLAQETGEKYLATIPSENSRSVAQRIGNIVKGQPENGHLGGGVSLRRTVIVTSKDFSEGILRKLHTQEVERHTEGIRRAETEDIHGFHGERAGTYMVGFDVIAYRDIFLVTYDIVVENNDDANRLSEIHPEFIEEAIRFADRIAEVNPSLSKVEFFKSGNTYMVKFTGPEVKYRSILRGAGGSQKPAPKDPDLLGTYEISMEDFLDSSKREELFIRIKNQEKKPSASNAFMVGENDPAFLRDEFTREVKEDVLRQAFQNAGAIKMFRWNGANVLAERNTGTFVKDGPNEAIMEQDTLDIFTEQLLSPILQKYPYFKLVFVKGLNLLNYKSLSLYQMARASTSRNQIYLPMNLLYLLHLSKHPEWVMEYIVTYESIRKENNGELSDEPVSVIRAKTIERLGAEGKVKQNAFVELLQLLASIEEIAQIISRESGEDLLLHLDSEGRLQIKRTGKDAVIFDLDTQKAVVEDYELRLTYWDILKAYLSGRKDSLTEVITKGLDLTCIRGLLIQTLLRRKLIEQDPALSEENLKSLAGIAEKQEAKKKIPISSKLLLDNVVKTGEQKFEYNQNATGIKYILEKVQSSFDIEIINESGIAESELKGLISVVFDLAKDKINVIAQGDAEKTDYKDGIVLLHENSSNRLKDLRSESTKVLIGEKGISFNVLLTVGIHKLLGIGEEEMKSLLVSLGYGEDEAIDIITKGLLILPPVRAFLPIINDIASFTRTIDIAA